MRRRARAGTSLAATLALAATYAFGCGPSVKTLPPAGEVLVVVDTDMPVPRLVNRLRIDLYTTERGWYASRDVSRPKIADWPTSFGAYLPDETRARKVVVRLRAYPEGEVRDYRGERFSPRPDASAAPFERAPVPAPIDQPRLVEDDGTDGTPKTEPSPLLAIDRLVLVRVTPGTRAAVRITLHGSCVGTMADLSGGKTCIDTENDRVAVIEEATIADTSMPALSAVGTFDTRAPCTLPTRPAGHAADGSPLYDEEACVDGAVFVFGSSYASGTGDDDDLPKRVAVLPPFRIDRHEVTVGRWRDALAHGFTTLDAPLTNDGPIPSGVFFDDSRGCTFSSAPIGREDYPLSCVPWEGARAFCRFFGGDLPTEAQFEYVALDAGRAFQTPFPWGGSQDVGAACEQVIFGRGPFPVDDECNPDGLHFGPAPVTESERRGDVSLGLRVVGMTGNLSELMLDAAARLDSNCWAAQPLASPSCQVRSPPAHAGRGADWTVTQASVIGARRSHGPLGGGPTVNYGFRCVRPGS